MDGSDTGRLEGFSDGVFSIAATLLVLELSIRSGGDLGSQLTALWPAYLAYATSFLTIGIIWMNHRYCVETLARADRTLLFLNLLLLLTVAFLPFPTRLVGQAAADRRRRRRVGGAGDLARVRPGRADVRGDVPRRGLPSAALFSRT